MILEEGTGQLELDADKSMTWEILVKVGRRDDEDSRMKP
jgi:hypothetical protein